MVESRPTLSVIVTSYNLDRLNDIIELLDSLETQSYDPDEIIIVVEKSMELYDRIKQYTEGKAARTSNTQRMAIGFNGGPE